MVRAFFWVMFVAGCSTGPSETADGAVPDLRVAVDIAQPPPFCTDGVDGGPAPTLKSVEYITNTNCSASGCHGDQFPQFANFDLRTGHVYASVVNVAASEACGGVRVVPGNPTASYLYQKISNPMPCNPPDANFAQMPRCEDGSCPIPDCEIDIIRRWILAGAPNQ